MQLTASLTAVSALLFVLVNQINVFAIPTGHQNLYNRETSNDTNGTPLISRILFECVDTPPPPIRTPIISLPNEDPRDFTDQSYAGLVTLGNRRNNFRMIIDTGSAHFWLLTGFQGTHNGIGPGSLGTFQLSNLPFSILYRDRSQAIGKVGVDRLTIGRASVEEGLVGVAEIVHGFVTTTKADRILGLASSRQSTMRQHTVVETLFARRAIPAMATGVKLSRLADRTSGEVSLGASKFDPRSQVASSNTRADGLWGIRVAGLTVNNQRIPIASAILDTGAQVIPAPPNAGGQFNLAKQGSIVRPQDDGTSLAIIP
ncbi:hypothetical protein EVG20_g7445 [Dentipellis fragilis]|uniref:Peptidase A1 domain-containing protein n=1 Tax=Dentipellis fragilis TaxID=205917 RepID=A0A4Y9YES6_9AGAM|nr:hypothetical protein EVG20_g7445 [Dentipellis fragilis]